VGKFKPNAWKLFDMHGNVWQWCKDWKREYEKEDVTDPVGSKPGSRVLRGGSWVHDAGSCRAASRRGSVPDNRYGGYGFRVVLAPRP
jgi:formylglycine-generating enzyme required for sulfatase activity